MQSSVTVIITCKNEIHNIAPCVQSARQIGDEILIADSGSQDGTWEWIRTQSDCRAIQREYVNAGNFKNWAIPQARHPWVLVLDADERITPELAAEIRAQLPANRYDGFIVRRLNHFLGHPIRYGSWGRDRVIRLFRRDVGRYVEKTDHSEVHIERRRLGRLAHPMLHYTCVAYEPYLAKMQWYAHQQARWWYRTGRRPSLLHLLGNGPMRFLRSYVAELGMLDGMPGLQIAMLTAYYSFLKQALLWGLWHARHAPATLATDRYGSVADMGVTFDVGS